MSLILVHSRYFYEATGRIYTFSLSGIIMATRNISYSSKFLRYNTLTRKNGMMPFFWQNEMEETAWAQLKTEKGFFCRVLNPSSPVIGYVIEPARLAKVLWINIHLLWDPRLT
jgi:hypothetical protein